MGRRAFAAGSEPEAQAVGECQELTTQAMNRETGDPGCVVAVPCRALHCGTEQNTLMHADAAGMRVVSSHPSLPYCYRNSRCRYAAIAASLAQTSAVGPLAAPRPLLIVQDSFSYSPTIRPLLPRAPLPLSRCTEPLSQAQCSYRNSSEDGRWKPSKSYTAALCANASARLRQRKLMPHSSSQPSVQSETAPRAPLRRGAYLRHDNV